MLTAVAVAKVTVMVAIVEEKRGKSQARRTPLGEVIWRRAPMRRTAEQNESGPAGRKKCLLF